MASKSSYQLTFGLLILDPEEHIRLARRQTRTCLRCRRGFPSEHAGNRICSDCKQSEIWGSPIAQFAAAAGF
jgi:hypothetical protein